MDAETALRQEAHWLLRGLPDVPEAHVRAMTYRPRINHKLQCPRCWVRNGLNMTLRSVPGTDDHDLLRCNDDRCAAEFVIPF